MHPEDRMILSKLLTNCDITNDIWFACEQGFIKPNELSELVEQKNYLDLLICLYNEWYKKRANPEQQLLCDLNGYLHLNDQFSDLTTIIALSVEKKLLNEKSESKIDVNCNDVFDSSIHSNLINLNEFDSGINTDMFSGMNDDFPLKETSDLENNTNMVYVLNYANKGKWKTLIQGLFFKLRNNNYEGRTVKSSMDWLFHYYEVNKQKNAEFSKMLCNDDIWLCENKELLINKKTFLADKLNIKKNKEENYAKKAIKRGLKLLSNFIEDKDINLFTTGDGFIVKAKLFNYKFKKSHTSIISHTLNPISYHIPYDLIVMNKDNLEIANLCIYFDETPIIDQIVSTILYLKSGNELDILLKGNFYNKRPRFHTDKTIRKHFKDEIKNEELQDNEYDLEKETNNTLHKKICSGIFNALPIFLSIDIPEFVYREFSNITFDYFLDNYARTGNIPENIISESFKIKIDK